MSEKGPERDDALEGDGKTRRSKRAKRTELKAALRFTAGGGTEYGAQIVWMGFWGESV